MGPTHKDSCWHGTPNVGMTGLRMACPGLDVAEDQLPSPWSLGVPAGKDICQRESWQLYFLFHLRLSLIHPSCSFSFSSFSSLSPYNLTPPFYSSVFLPDFPFSILLFSLSTLCIPNHLPSFECLSPLPYHQCPQFLAAASLLLLLLLLHLPSCSLYACRSG